MVAVLILVSLVSFLPGFFNIPPIDRDEARFAQATKQMIESGDYIDIRFQDEVRYKKPVGIYWLQAGVVRAAEALGVRNARTTIWLYRVPSLIGAIGAVLLTYWAALAFVSRRDAFLAGLMMATCVLLGVEARLAKTDAMLLLCAVAAMGVMARAYLTPVDRARYRMGHALHPLDRARRRHVAQGSADPDGGRARGAACSSSPIAPRAGCCGCGRWSASCGFCVLVLPWFIAIMGRAGESFLQESVGQDLLAKISRGRRPTARRPAITCCCSGSRSGRRRRSPPLRRPRSGGIGASRRCAFCWPGSCRAGSCSNWS